MHDELCLWPAHRQVASIRAGEITSRELLERYIARIESIDQTLNAVVTRDFENARRAADEADAALADGKEVGPLHGLPVTIKDALETKGLRSTGGATELSNYIPKRDAPVVQAVKNAGAYVIGKTNLPRWSGDAQASNKIFGTTNNPWNVERGPGGSSGGAAAAVATGLTSFEIGTDIGGSIRFPAAFCGVFGHKPSFGIVPSTGYLDCAEGGTTEADVNVIGPIARSAEDLDLLLSVLLRRDRPWSIDLPDAEDLGSLKVAAWLDDEAYPVDSEVLDVTTKAVDALDAAGVAVDRSRRPDIDFKSAVPLANKLIGAACPSLDTKLTHLEWHAADRERLKVRDAWNALFEDVDIMLMPVCIVPPFPHLDSEARKGKPLIVNGEARSYWDVASWTMLVGMAYLPATVPPIGLSETGLPIGIQVVGRYGADRTTIRFAERLSELCGGYQPPPIALTAEGK
ncbi:MAG: amidase family protein [Gammaproteobacteria bacterium]|nr:amidase family protein [Gammaproteobacteria bacterium]